MKSADHVVRAMTDEGTFRIVATRTTETIQGIIDAQSATGTTATLLGEIATAAVLYRETMAPTLRVQCIARGAAGSGTLVADSHPDGWVRALAQRKKGSPPFRLTGDGALIQLMRSLPNGALHQGTVAIPEDGRIASGMMAYMDLSEQVLSMISMATILEDDGKTVRAAGGYLVQLLPEVRDERGVLLLMSERMKDFVDIGERLVSTDAAPEHLVEEIFYGMPFTYLESSDVRFGCNCSRERVLASLGTLGRKDIDELVSSDELLDLHCEYCGRDYQVSPEELRGMLEPS
ncbi:MAG: Hsp33 family molecular chaperone HslO [Polyangiaceae bacterium]|nr:Hsp33 family molecular chaperone HslO [Polyangiaceae bacterium]